MWSIDTISGIGAIVVLVAWYFIAKGDNLLCRFMRVIWNFWFSLFAGLFGLIPVIGELLEDLLARLIINTPEE